VWQSLCNGAVSIFLSHLSTIAPVCAGSLLWAQRAGVTYGLLHGRCSACSVAMSVDAGSWTQACYVRMRVWLIGRVRSTARRGGRKNWSVSWSKWTRRSWIVTLLSSLYRVTARNGHGRRVACSRRYVFFPLLYFFTSVACWSGSRVPRWRLSPSVGRRLLPTAVQLQWHATPSDNL